MVNKGDVKPAWLQYWQIAVNRFRNVGLAVEAVARIPSGEDYEPMTRPKGSPNLFEWNETTCMETVLYFGVMAD